MSIPKLISLVAQMLAKGPPEVLTKRLIAFVSVEGEGHEATWHIAEPGAEQKIWLAKATNCRNFSAHTLLLTPFRDLGPSA